MAETFSKRERRKKKIERRREKELRRDERRNTVTKGKSLDEMMAYVDENGNLSETPPDPKKSYTIAAEEIVIDIPKAAPADSEELPTGVISYFDPAKGYGFIVDEQTKERLFVHVKSLVQPDMELNTGDRVSYTAMRSQRGMQAVAVMKR